MTDLAEVLVRLGLRDAAQSQSDLFRFLRDAHRTSDTFLIDSDDSARYPSSINGRIGLLRVAP
jgi:hypothetical protein